MTTVIKVPGVDWSGRGYPNVVPFVANSDLEFAYDFSDRANRLADVTGKHADLVPKRQDIVAGIYRVVDPTILVSDVSGQGVSVQMGYLETDMPLANIPVDGSKQFTIMVAGGYSGIPFPSNKVAATSPGLSTLFDYGTAIGSNGFCIEAALASAQIDSRIKSGSPALTTTITSVATPCVTFLTYDGTSWSLINKTMGNSETKTNASMGITTPIPVSTAFVTKAVIGHYHGTSTLSAAYPMMYQLAYWNKVLSGTEINEQYARTKAIKTSVAF